MLSIVGELESAHTKLEARQYGMYSAGYMKIARLLYTRQLNSRMKDGCGCLSVIRGTFVQS